MSNDKKIYKVAILIPGKSEGMSHYTKRFAAFLQVALPGMLTIEGIDYFAYLERKDDFLALLEEKRFDFFLPFGHSVGKLFSDLIEEKDLAVRGMALCEQGINHKPLCDRLALYYARNSGHRYAAIFSQLLPMVTTVVVCATKNQFAQEDSEINRVGEYLRERNILVIENDILDGGWREPLKGLPAQKTGVFISFEGEIHAILDDIVSIAINNKYFTMASNVHAIHQDVDFALGYSEQAAIGEVAQKVEEYLKGAPLSNDPVWLPLSLHVNMTRLGRYTDIVSQIERLVLEEEESALKVHIHSTKEAVR